MLPGLTADSGRRLLVINDPGRLAEIARNRYPDVEVITRATYLAGNAA